MTTICFDGRFVAADSLQCCNQIRHLEPAKKLRTGTKGNERSAGKVFAVTAYAGMIDPWIKWYEDGAEPTAVCPISPEDSESTLLVFDEKGATQYCHDLPHPVEMGSVCVAWGSGREIAMGAMDYSTIYGPGAHGSAVHGVKIACRRDPHSAYPIIIYDLFAKRFVKVSEFERSYDRPPQSSRGFAPLDDDNSHKLAPQIQEGTTVCRYCRFPPNECKCGAHWTKEEKEKYFGITPAV